MKITLTPPAISVLFVGWLKKTLTQCPQFNPIEAHSLVALLTFQVDGARHLL